MPDNFQTNPGTGGSTFAADDVAGVLYPRSKLTFGVDGSAVDASATDPLPVTVANMVAQGLTDTQLRATPVPVSGTFFQATQPVSIASMPSTPVTGTFWQATQPVSAASLPLPTGAATETTLAALNTKMPAQGQALMAASQPVVIASNQSPVTVLEAATVLTGQAAQTAVINNILEAVAGANGTDVSNLRAASVQVVSTGTAGTFIFEQSNDNVNWVALPVFNAALVTGVPITAAITASASAIIYSFPLRCRFIRLRIATLITGGSIQAFSRLSSEPWTAAAQLVASNTAANLAATVSGTVTANIGTGSLAAGTNAIGDVGLQGRANATGATSVAKILAAATTNATSVKATAGRVFGWHLTNTTAAVKVVRLYNLAVAPTVGTSVPVYNIVIPANGHVSESFPVGIGHATGISYAITNAIADLDATAVAANDVIGAIYWL